MGNIYEDLVEHAEILVNIINKKYVAGNSVAYLALLSGIGNCKVESFAGAGHNYQAVIDAIHNCYARNPLSNINVGYQEGMEAMIRVASNVSTLQNVVNIVFYQLKKEKDGKSKFMLDREKILTKLNATIRENYGLYEKENASFVHWMERNQKYALDNYGIELG